MSRFVDRSIGLCRPNGLADGSAGRRAQDSFLLTVFVKRDQSKTIDQINGRSSGRTSTGDLPVEIELDH
jgi:hypothetical protein